MFKPILATLTATLLLGSLFATPAVKAEDPPAITRRDLQKSANNLKQIALAVHNHQSAYNALPGDILDKDGKPLLSWRVAILPFVEETVLYQQFKLDEPWDSANNKKLIEKMPKLYAPVRVKGKEGETFYQTFTGEGTVFVKNKPVYNIGNIPDGTSNTGMVFEAGEPVIWSKPVDLAFDAKKPLPKLGGLFDGDCHVAMFDGSVMLLKKDADEKELKNLIMPADGFNLDLKKLKK
jgi:Protein of unknown function (DUF1559)